MSPSLVTCPTTKIATPNLFAISTNRNVDSLICPGDPAAPPTFSVLITCIESTTTILNTLFARSNTSPNSSIELLAKTSMFFAFKPNLFTLKLICSGDSSPATYSPLTFPNNCVKSVLLPIPGSPENSTTEPRTIPLPNTLSNSPIVVEIISLFLSLFSSNFAKFLTSIFSVRADLVPAFFDKLFFTSFRLFHSLQKLHCPIHLLNSFPQLVHTNIVSLTLAIHNSIIYTISFSYFFFPSFLQGRG